MILRELYELYGRLVTEGAEVPRMGCSLLPVSFRIVLRANGELVRIEDARTEVAIIKKTKKGEITAYKLEPTPVMLLGSAKPSGKGLNPCFLWDNAAYLLGYVDAKKQIKASRNRDSFESLRRKHLAYEETINSPAYSAFCRFLESWKPENIAEWVEDAAILSHNGVIRLQGELQDLHKDATLCRWWEKEGKTDWWGDGNKREKGRCLITNDEAPIARLHEPAIKGVLGAQTSGAKLVSFNCKSFESYGFEQSANAPVSESAAFAYCNALNYLLASKENCVRIGETTVVFWTDAPPQEARAMEAVTQWVFGSPSLHEESVHAAPSGENLLADVRAGMKAIAQGKLPADALELPLQHRFFILGLSPNAARLSVRFYRESTFGEFLQNLRSHLEGMRLVKSGGVFREPDVISPFLILRESVRDISKELPPFVIGGLMSAIISGTLYPDMLAMSILRRFKADGNINYIRCAFLKAWLARNHHLNITTMLDTNNTQPGYLLGRLFAAYVKTQEDALGQNLNRSIREAYYGSASSAPRCVFPRLQRLYNNHLGKLEGGRKVNREKLLQEIMGGLKDFPAYLSLAEQGAFAIGYYHQMQAFYTSAETSQAKPAQGELPLS